MRRASFLLLALPALLLGACDNQTPVECPTADLLPDGGIPTTGETYTLVIGKEDADGTRVATPWHDGDHVPFVMGSQGGWMIRPSFDVTTPTPLQENNHQFACLAVRMIPASSASTFSPTYADTALVRRVPGTTSTYHVLRILGLLDYSRSTLDGFPQSFYFAVLSDTGAGAARMTLTPDSTVAP